MNTTIRVLENPVKRTCRMCDGTGIIYVEVFGGSWNSYYGTYEPDERREVCETCEGDGWEWVEQADPEEEEDEG